MVNPMRIGKQIRQNIDVLKKNLKPILNVRIGGNFMVQDQDGFWYISSVYVKFQSA